ADETDTETPETEPRVLSLLSRLQNEEMEKMDSVLARCLSQSLDWGKISRDADAFWTKSLSGVVLDAVERELSPVIQSSAASQVVLAAYQLGYVCFEQRYKSSPLEIFVDCVELKTGQALAPISRLMARVWGNGDSGKGEAKMVKPKHQEVEETEKRRVKEVSIDSTTMVPSDLYWSLLRAGERAKNGGQHRLKERRGQPESPKPHLVRT
ncbi:unnamed protein product, partial [Durusdinium trenchii]